MTDYENPRRYETPQESVWDTIRSSDTATKEKIQSIIQPYLDKENPRAQELFDKQQLQLAALDEKYRTDCRNIENHSISCRADLSAEIPWETTKLLEQIKQTIYESFGITQWDSHDGFTGLKKWFIDWLV